MITFSVSLFHNVSRILEHYPNSESLRFTAKDRTGHEWDVLAWDTEPLPAGYDKAQAEKDFLKFLHTIVVESGV